MVTSEDRRQAPVEPANETSQVSLSVVGRADVATTLASRYLQQLCKHWSHKFVVEFTPTDGRIDFGDGRTCVLRAKPETLCVEAFAPADDLPRFQEVIERHVQRFAHREGELRFAWTSD